jgi:1,4-alpha-glucan branching enzyme
LFGHWWFEGPWFLEGVFRRLAQGPSTLSATTLRGYLHQHPQMVRATPAASTWGARGHSTVWMDQPNAWMWRHVHHAGRELAATLQGNKSGAVEGAIEQAVAELLLLQSSDWPFILSTRTAEGYASARARAHAARLRELTAMIDRGEIDDRRLADLCSRDDFLAAIREQLPMAFG